jgi:hypothetical protein
LLEI